MSIVVGGLFGALVVILLLNVFLGLASLAEIERLRAVVQRADSYLSLLRHRCATVIPWGSVGIPTARTVDEVIGECRAAIRAQEEKT